MCPPTATAVIEYFNRNKRTVYGCDMDLSKAFHFVEWVELFKISREKKGAPVYLRIMLLIYSNLYCDVNWNTSFPHLFPVLNGIRQQ